MNKNYTFDTDYCGDITNIGTNNGNYIYRTRVIYLPKIHEMVVQGGYINDFEKYETLFVKRNVSYRILKSWLKYYQRCQDNLYIHQREELDERGSDYF